jgi:predicted DNA-binding transcriptional regulator AlpA
MSLTPEESFPTKRKPPQVEVARKARALKERTKRSALPPKLAAANEAHQHAAGLADKQLTGGHDREHAHGARGPPPPAVRLLSKGAVCAIAGVSFPTLWLWMRKGSFPRGREMGGKTVWRSDEVQAWLDALPVRTYKPIEADDSDDGEART